MAPLAVAFLASSAIKLYGGIKANKAKRKSLLHKEAMYNQQANEMQRRATENYAIMESQGMAQVADLQFKSVGMSGQMGSSSMQALTMSSYKSMYDELARQKRVDDYQIAMTRLNGNVMGGEAAEVNRQTATTALSTGLDTYTTGKTNKVF